MKIGFVLDDTLDSTDGVQQYVLTLGGWLAEHGHDVHYLVGRTERTDIPNINSLSRNVSVRFNGNRMSMPLPADRDAIRRLLKREKFDVLHIQVPYSPWLAGRIINSAPATTAIVGTFHVAPNSFLVSAANFALARWAHRSLRRFDRIVSVSRAASDFARRTYGIRTDIIPNAVDLARYQTRYKDKSNGGEVPTIAFVGRLVPRKGCQVLLDAVKLLREQHPELRYKVSVCGRGPLLDGLKEFVKANGLQDIVEFAGFVSEEEKVRRLQQASLAVFPSSGGESFGIVLIEAMAAGSPVVLGADNPGYRTVLSPKPDLLFPIGNAGELASRVRKYLTDDAARRDALYWQREYVGRFDVAVVTGKMLAVYDAAIETRMSS